MVVTIHTPVFRLIDSDRKMNINRSLIAGYGYTNSTFIDFSPETVQYLMDRRAGIYATYAECVAHKCYLSHFERQEIDIPEDDVYEIPSVGIYVEVGDEGIDYNEEYARRTIRYGDGRLMFNLGIHFYNFKYAPKNQPTRNALGYLGALDYWFDAQLILNGYDTTTWYQTEDWALREEMFFDVVFRGRDPVPFDDYPVVDLDQVEQRKRRKRDNHYVYTLSYGSDIVYVGYTANPQQRQQQHIFYQTNPYLKKIIDERGVPKMSTIYKCKDMYEALDYEAEMIMEYGKHYELANIRKNPYR